MLRFIFASANRFAHFNNEYLSICSRICKRKATAYILLNKFHFTCTSLPFSMFCDNTESVFKNRF